MTVPRQWQFSLLVVLVVLVVFFPVCGFDFLHYDDRVNVWDNPLVRDFSFDGFLQFWRRPYEGLYIPLTYTVWGLLAKVAGDGAVLDPAPFHTVNLMLHAATAAALFSLLRLLVKDDLAAAGGALFFALHPLVVEPVAWVSELKGLLSGFLSVLALRQYLLYGAGTGKADHGSTGRHYLLATLFFAAAVLAKPSSLVLPMLAGLLGYFSQSRPGKDLLRELTPWLVLVLPLAIATKYAQPDSQFPFVPDLWERVLVAGYAMGFYFLKVFWPFSLAPDYGQTPSVLLANKALYLTGLIPWFLLCGALAKKARTWLVVIGFPFCSLLPVLGFIPFTFQGTSTVADRYVYLGLIGPALGVAMLLARHRGRQVRMGALIILAALAVVSSIQLRHWQNTPTLMRHILKVNPHSWTATHDLGLHFQENNQLAEAVEYYNKAIVQSPGFYLSYYNLGYIAFMSNDLEGAVKFFEKVVKIKPDFVAGYQALGRSYELMNRKEDSAAAYRKALSLKPAAKVYNQLGLVCLELGRFDEAEAVFRKASDLGGDTSDGLARLEKARGKTRVLGHTEPQDAGGGSLSGRPERP